MILLERMFRSVISGFCLLQ
ncbi:hypothetical protein Nmel_006886 [Mimus melanotis]